MPVVLDRETVIELMENNGKYVGVNIAKDFNVDIRSEELANVLAKSYKELASKCPTKDILLSSEICFTGIKNTVRISVEEIVNKDINPICSYDIVLDTSYIENDVVIETIKECMGINT